MTVAKIDPLEQYLIDNISIPDYFNLYLADKSKGIVQLHEEASTATICPFHDDVNPSFRYWKPKRFFMCFGCGAAGDVINLHRLALQRKLQIHISRRYATNDLCKLYNIKVSSSKAKGNAPAAPRTGTDATGKQLVFEDISVFDRCRKAIDLQAALVEHRKHFNLAMFRATNDQIKARSNIDLEARFKAFEDLDTKASISINATDDHFTDLGVLSNTWEDYK